MKRTRFFVLTTLLVCTALLVAGCSAAPAGETAPRSRSSASRAASQVVSSAAPPPESTASPDTSAIGSTNSSTTAGDFYENGTYTIPLDYFELLAAIHGEGVLATDIRDDVLEELGESEDYTVLSSGDNGISVRVQGESHRAMVSSIRQIQSILDQGPNEDAMARGLMGVRYTEDFSIVTMEVDDTIYDHANDMEIIMEFAENIVEARMPLAGTIETSYVFEDVNDSVEPTIYSFPDVALASVQA